MLKKSIGYVCVNKEETKQYYWTSSLEDMKELLKELIPVGSKVLKITSKHIYKEVDL